MRATRVQLSRAKGWRMPPNTVKVDRTTKWGNPYKVGPGRNAMTCVGYFAMLLGAHYVIGIEDPCLGYLRAYHEMFAANWRELAGKNLACWCRKDQPCHADVLLRAVRLLDRRAKR